MSPSDFVTRGQALVSSGQYQEAVKVCRLGLLGRPTTVEGRVVLGQALLALKRYDEVLAEMRVALELDHGSQAAQVLKGEALLRKGDGQAAIEVFVTLRDQSATEPRLPGLLAEAERLAGRAPPGLGGHAVGFVAQDPGAFAVEQSTKAYPAQADAPPGVGIEDAGGEYTRPTSIAAPGSKKRPAPRGDATPPPAVLAVGDRSGTVEVDPEAEGVTVRASDDELGDLVGPPVAQASAALDRGPRGAGVASSRSSKLSAVAAAVAAKKPRRAGMFKEEVSTVELDDEEMIEVADTMSPDAPLHAPARKVPGPGTAVRNAVRMPSGPIDQGPPLEQRPQPAPHLAQLIASQPHVMNVVPQPSSRSAIAAALPTAAAMPMQPPMSMGMPPTQQPMMPPPMQQPQYMQAPQAYGQAPQAYGQVPQAYAQPPQGYGQPPQAYPQPMQQPPYQQPGMPPLGLQATQLQQQQPPGGSQFPQPLNPAAAHHPTIALNPMQQQSASAVDAMFNGQGGQGGPGPAWGRGPSGPGGPGGPGPNTAPRAGADDQTRQPHPRDPRSAAMINESGAEPVPAASFGDSGSVSKPVRAGARKARSRLQILLWVMIGSAVIGGGVFAGFQIRALRLRKQIVAARDRSVDLAKADTWQGWVGARDSLSGIAQASPTLDNRAAVARARALLAFEFGDPVGDAKAAVDGLAGQTGLDVELASAYLALARSDAKAASEAADRAKKVAASDPAALYVSGQAALLAGDAKTAVDELRAAFEHEPRPLYGVGLARALAATSALDEAIAIVNRTPDNPAAVIARAWFVARAGRVVPAQATALRAPLLKVVAEGAKQTGEQPRGVSPAQVAFAELALARIDFALGDLGASHADYRASLEQRLDDQRFAEEITDTLYAIGELDAARTAANLAIANWPASRRARTTLAQVWLAQGKPAAAQELYTASPDTAGWPRGQTVRGQVRQANGDVDGARADFDAVLKKLPGYEPALVARAWLDLSIGEIEQAKRRLEPKFNAKTATLALVTVYAATLRMAGEPAKAKPLLESLAGTKAWTPEAARAQLELGRIDRDLDDMRGARAAYAEASRTGGLEARLESAVLLFDDADPHGGRTTLEQLLKEAAPRPSANLLIETARARALLGDHSGAGELLGQAEKVSGVVRWQLERERGRLALRRGDTSGAAQALERALPDCGSDIDTFILTADTVAADAKQASLAAKLKSLAPTRLKGMPEIDIIEGKLHLAAGAAATAAGHADEAQKEWAAAEKSYKAANAAFATDNASRRRLAQVNFGLAAILYEKRDDPDAIGMLELTITRDPSNYAAYLYAAEIARSKGTPKGKLDGLELAQKATAFNPDSVDAWLMEGELAAEQKPLNRKLLNDAITHLGDLVPGSEALRHLQAMR